jgi:hypothetical protein
MADPITYDTVKEVANSIAGLVPLFNNGVIELSTKAFEYRGFDPEKVLREYIRVYLAWQPQSSRADMIRRTGYLILLVLTRGTNISLLPVVVGGERAHKKSLAYIATEPGLDASQKIIIDGILAMAGGMRINQFAQNAKVKGDVKPLDLTLARLPALFPMLTYYLATLKGGLRKTYKLLGCPEGLCFNGAAALVPKAPGLNQDAANIRFMMDCCKVHAICFAYLIRNRGMSTKDALAFVAVSHDSEKICGVTERGLIYADIDFPQPPTVVNFNPVETVEDCYNRLMRAGVLTMRVTNHSLSIDELDPAAALPDQVRF